MKSKVGSFYKMLMCLMRGHSTDHYYITEDTIKCRECDDREKIRRSLAENK